MELGKVWAYLKRLEVSLGFTPFEWDADLDVVPSLRWAYLGAGPFYLELHW